MMTGRDRNLIPMPFTARAGARRPLIVS
jgi:hypothetical protein